MGQTAEEVKLCPFRVRTEEHIAIAVGHGNWTTQSFYPCVMGRCAAWYQGECMRVQEAKMTMPVAGLAERSEE